MCTESVRKNYKTANDILQEPHHTSNHRLFPPSQASLDTRTEVLLFLTSYPWNSQNWSLLCCKLHPGSDRVGSRGQQNVHSSEVKKSLPTHFGSANKSHNQLIPRTTWQPSDTLLLSPYHLFLCAWRVHWIYLYDLRCKYLSETTKKLPKYKTLCPQFFWGALSADYYFCCCCLFGFFMFSMWWNLRLELGMQFQKEVGSTVICKLQRTILAERKVEPLSTKKVAVSRKTSKMTKRIAKRKLYSQFEGKRGDCCWNKELRTVAFLLHRSKTKSCDSREDLQFYFWNRS